MATDPASPVKPPRKKRGASKFIVLKKDPDVSLCYATVAEGTTVDACRKAIIEGKLEGDLLIVCVRFRLTATKRETVDIKITS